MNDSIIIGAGPAGLHLAHRLAAAGLKVALVDAQTYIGEHAVCSGVIGAEAFSKFGLPTRSLVTKIHTFRAVSPAGQTLEHHSSLPLARVVNKAEFNRDLAAFCRKSGVRFHLGQYVDLVRQEKNGVLATCRSRSGETTELRGRVAVIASGVNGTLARKLGLVKPREFLRAVQADVTIGSDGAAQPTEIYVGRHVAPGGFGWKIPLGKGRYRLGVMCSCGAKPYFQPLLARVAPRVPMESVQLSAKAIAQVPVGKTVAERMLVIGEAAGHVKTSTAGGIYFGLLSAEFASQVLLDAFRRGSFSSHILGEFERYCQSAFGKEILFGYLARKMAGRFPDAFIERTFTKAKAVDFFGRLSGSLKFDWHQQAILAGIRTLFDFS